MSRFVPPGSSAPLVLLNPGPSNVTQGVADALLRGDMCHREPEFFDVQRSIRRMLLEAFVPGAEERYTSVLITGSGTAALEATVSSVIGPDQTLLVLENGVYGERMSAIADAHGIRHESLRCDWTQPHTAAALERALAEKDVDLVGCVHHETTTGLLNPLREIAAVCQAAGKPLVVDAISSLAGETLDVAGWGIDALVCTANKCVRGVAGMAFTLLSRELMQQIESYPPRTLYLNLATYHAKQENDGTPFTPAVQVAYAFEQALRELLEEGVEARVAKLRKLAAHLRAGYERLGLKRLLADDALLSTTITTLELPEGWTYEALHDGLKESGFVIYAGQGDLRTRAFRIANMGVMDLADADRLLEALERLLAGGAPA